MGAECSNSESKFVGFIEDDDELPIELLMPGILRSRFIRNTNASRAYKQKGGICYAHAACSAYINTIMRIYGARPTPSFGECLKVASFYLKVYHSQVL